MAVSMRLEPISENRSSVFWGGIRAKMCTCLEIPGKEQIGGRDRICMESEPDGLNIFVELVRLDGYGLLN